MVKHVSFAVEDELKETGNKLRKQHGMSWEEYFEHLVETHETSGCQVTPSE